MKDEKLYKITENALICFKEHLPSYGNRQTFPKNYCEEVSSILLSILEDEGYTYFKMMKGSNKKNEHHFWLESETHIIDLTAHQFNGINQPFLLIRKTEYPLSKVFSKDVHIKPINTNWKFLNDILLKIKKIYSINKQNKSIKNNHSKNDKL